MNPDAIAKLLAPYLVNIPQPTSGWQHLYERLTIYLDLLLKWNARTNLTAIRQPEEIVKRHFGESLFAAAQIGLAPQIGPGLQLSPAAPHDICGTLLDFGSGAGFPGIPIQLLRPDLAVTLAESQSKKAAFLREALRTLGLRSEVFGARVESMPNSIRFDTVALRAVDNMTAALQEAGQRSRRQILVLTSTASLAASILDVDFELDQRLTLPESSQGILEVLHRR